MTTPTTPERHYARGLELLDLAERCTETHQLQAVAVLAQSHFSAAVAGATLRTLEAAANPPRMLSVAPAADHHARPAEEPYEGPKGEHSACAWGSTCKVFPDLRHEFVRPAAGTEG